MPVHDDLGKRMKEYYEQIPKTRLMRRCPVAIRIDGKCFSTFTKGFKKPFDEILMKSMQETMKYLCENIQGCVFGYTQSDEITLILVDYKKLNSGAWFDYEVQKMCSIGASMATMYFNKVFYYYANEYVVDNFGDDESDILYIEALSKSVHAGAMFDCRCFNIPKEEVTNLIYWRQIDAARNSIQMVGRAYFSHNQLKNKNTSAIQDMLMDQFGVNWNDFPVTQKRGTSCIKRETGWEIDTNMPMLKNEDRAYVDDLINAEEE